MPYFSVVLATHNRGVHILPTVHSVLAQSFRDFELLVVGDRCTDDTGSVLLPLLGDRVKWINLADRSGSRSLPNNAGIAKAGGDYIAYIGDQDLWAPDHLERLAGIFAQRFDFGISGSVRHPAPGARDFVVLGLFDDDQAKFEHVFPVSSLAHARLVTQSIGDWRDAREIKAPVETDFQLRAVEAGMTFASTGKVTAHEFVAATRYLSRVRPQSQEQVELLARMQRAGFEQEVEAIVEASKRAGTYMSLRHPPYEDCVAGEISRRHGYDSGAIRPALQELSRSASIRQTNEPRGLDWLQFKTGETRFRWSYLNPRPKILIPYTGTSRASLRIEVAHEDPEILKGLGVELNGAPAKVRIEEVCCRGAVSEATAAMTVALSETDYSIAVIILPPADHPDGGGSAVGVAQLTLDALPPGATAPGWTEEGERRIAVALAREKALLQQFKELPSGEITMLEERISHLKATFSWRLTAPLRELRRAATKVAKEMRRFKRKVHKEITRAERKYLRHG